MEFDSVRALLVSLAGSAPGRARLERLQPATDPATVRDALALTSEATVLLDAPGRQPYHDLPDLGEILPQARAAGAHLDPQALRQVASFIEGATEIARRVARAASSPRLSRRASEVRDLGDVAAAIRRAILPTGELADDA
ncbi:MAG: hypothetical protein JNM82_05675, partial [Rhodocyclaceae bacterium]|nr:hypothetical protein [Rhodocyclaceae bacterium]